MPAPTVLEKVLGETGFAPSEYFERLNESLEEARQQRMHRLATSHDTGAFIQEETAAPDFLLPEEDVTEEPIFAESEEEEFRAAAGAGRARPRKGTRARATRAVEPDEEDELAAFGLESLDEDETQFERAYRRAIRGSRRPAR